MCLLSLSFPLCSTCAIWAIPENERSADLMHKEVFLRPRYLKQTNLKLMTKGQISTILHFPPPLDFSAQREGGQWVPARMQVSQYLRLFAKATLKGIYAYMQ